MKLVKKMGIAVVIAATPLLVQAAGTPAQPGPAQGVTGVPSTAFVSVQSTLNFVCTIFAWMFYFLIALAVVFGVIAAFRYLTSAGNAEGVKSANSTLLYAAIAVAVALLAKGIPLIVSSFLGGGTNIGNCGAGGIQSTAGSPATSPLY